MATKTYTLNLGWDNSTSKTFTFSLPDDKPADYKMVVELDNGSTYEKTISVGTAPHTYKITANLTDGSTKDTSFTTPACVYEKADFNAWYNPVYPDSNGTLWTSIINHNAFAVGYTINYYYLLNGETKITPTSRNGMLSANSGTSTAVEYDYYYNGYPISTVQVVFKDKIDGVSNYASVTPTLTTYKVSYPAKPTNVSVFQIYQISAGTTYPLVSNPVSAGSISVEAGAYIYAVVTPSDGYAFKSISGISVDQSNPTQVGSTNTDITISNIVLAKQVSIDVLFPGFTKTIAISQLQTELVNATLYYYGTGSETAEFSGYSDYGICTIDGIAVGTDFTTIKTSTPITAPTGKFATYSAKFVDGVLTVKSYCKHVVSTQQKINMSCLVYSTTATFTE